MEGMKGLLSEQQKHVQSLPWENEVIREDMIYMLKKFGKPERFAKKTIVITGGGGFIGYYLTLFLLYLSNNADPIHQIYILDSFTRGKPKWLLDLENGGWPPLKVCDFDVTKDSFEPYVKEADFLFHLASIASPTHYRRFPLETLEANVIGLKRLFDECRSGNPEGILFFSSSEVYGNPDSNAIPTPETYNGNVPTTGPRACYDESKRLGETLCYIYHELYRLPIRIVRPFNNFGPGLGLNDRRITSDFAKAIVNPPPPGGPLRSPPPGTDIEIYSSGLPTRTYLYIADAIVGYLLVLTHDRFDIFNIGSDAPEISVSDTAALFAECARELTGKRTSILYCSPEDYNYLTHNPERRCPNIQKAKQLLGFQPEIGLKEGIRRYLTFNGVKA